MAVLATLHQASPFLTMTDRVAFVREGRIETVGPPAVVQATADRGMRDYLQ
jgi:ABC-type transporter Mla maintaining outer membrane lipid asymmetry ATPase subunit MlaF